MTRFRKFAAATALAAFIAAGAGGWFLYHRYGPLHPSATQRVSLGAVAACTGQPRGDRMECYRKAFTGRVDREGVGPAMAALQTLSELDPDVARDGHVYAHGIGIEGYLHFRSVPETFTHCPVDFSSGCGHGVIQAYLESRGAVDSAAITQLCDPYRDPNAGAWQLFQCVHGMGHGLNMMYRGDLPRTLQSCDLLGTEWDRESCYGGAFMENIMSETSPHHPATELAAEHEHDHMNMDMGAAPAFKRLDPADPLYPCSIMAHKYLRACYDIQTSAMMHYLHGSVARVSQACDTAPEEWRPGCYKSLGRDISSKAGRNPGRTKRYCDRGNPSYRPWCYFGAVKALIDWRANTEDGMSFCRVLGGARGWVFCYRGVGEQVAALAGTQPERERLCATAQKPEGVAACRYGAYLPGSVLPIDDSGAR